MSSEDPKMADARPFHHVALNGFWMDRTEATNKSLRVSLTPVKVI